MRIVTLVENTSCCAELIPQHGLSLYIEANGQKILFDMGQDDTFARNAEYLGIDLTQIDLAVLSHGHYDHGGGLETFLRMNQKAPVYLHPEAFGRYYNGKEKYIGLDYTLQAEKRLIFTGGSMRINSALELLDCNGFGWENDSWGLNRKVADTFLPDVFRHEQYLLITEGEKQILISGCSHKGIVNISRYFAPDVLVGGFHLSKQESTTELKNIADQLLALKTLFYTGHCTGEKQYQFMKKQMGERLQKICTGTEIRI